MNHQPSMLSLSSSLSSSLLLTVFIWLCILVNRAASVVVVTAIYPQIHSSSSSSAVNYSAVDLFLSMNFMTFVYADSETIQRCLLMGYDDDSRIQYIDYAGSDFMTQAFLSLVDSDNKHDYNENQDDDIDVMLSIEKIFMVSNAISQNLPTFRDRAYAWVDYDAFDNIDFFPLFVGFPDPRKIKDVDALIVSSSEFYSLRNDPFNRNPPRFVVNEAYQEGSEEISIELLTGSVLIGGAGTWMALRDRNLQFLIEGSRAALHPNFGGDVIKYWKTLLLASVADNYQLLPSSLDLVSVSDIYINALFYSSQELFCPFDGNLVVFYELVLPKRYYLLYQYSYNPIANYDYRCIDYPFFESKVKGERLVDLAIISPDKIVSTIDENFLQASSSAIQQTEAKSQMCAIRQFEFFGHCFCMPGFGPVDDCSMRLARYEGCECGSMDPRIAGARCLQICSTSADAGIVIANSGSMWVSANELELSYWLSNTDVFEDRQWEHMEGFQNYLGLESLFSLQFLKGFGKLIEFGSGPFTQTRHILSLFPFVPVDSVTLVDPNLEQYRSLLNCAYRNGSLALHPALSNLTASEFEMHYKLELAAGRQHSNGWIAVTTDLVSSKVEDLSFHEEFDTAISINVLEHVLDATTFLTRVHAALKPGGLLIFHDRWFEKVNAAEEVLGSFDLHPVRVSKAFLIQFLSKYYPSGSNSLDGMETTPEGYMVSTITTTAMKNRGYNETCLYVIAQKRQ